MANARLSNVDNLQRTPELRPFLLEKDFALKTPNISRRSGKRDSRTIKSSSDSSFLETALARDIHEQNREEPAMVSKIERKERQTRHNEGRTRCHTTSSVERNELHSLILQDTKIFDRRKRHKTRETRYDSIKVPNTSRSLKREKRKPEKSKSQRKLAGHADHFIQNFSSRSVGQDRLTVRLETFH